MSAAPGRPGGVVGRGVTTVLVRGKGIAGEQIVALAATDRVAARGHLEVNEANRHTSPRCQVVGRRGAIAVGGQGIAGDNVVAAVLPAIALRAGAQHDRKSVVMWRYESGRVNTGC